MIVLGTDADHSVRALQCRRDLLQHSRAGQLIFIVMLVRLLEHREGCGQRVYQRHAVTSTLQLLPAEKRGSLPLPALSRRAQQHGHLECTLPPRENSRSLRLLSSAAAADLRMLQRRACCAQSATDGT